ncbi:MAG TPA: membrane protein insertion efficiency factor YidD [Methylomirabilota bacterium]|nr:membrane protein insertion efficiency factor YidD [Methylomirabilota bacterium]
MKTFLIIFITFYHKFISPLLRQLLGQQTMCRYTPSCSVYAIDAIKRYGVLKGALMACNRFIHCQPYSNHYASL